MWGLTTSRPRHCLKIGAQALVWGEAVRTWRGRYRYRCVLSPTPTGAIKLSPMDLNLTDMFAVESRLRSLATFYRRHVCQIQIHRGQLDSPGRCRREDTAVAITPPPGADGLSPGEGLRSDFQAEPRTTSGKPPHHLPFLAKRHSIDLAQGGGTF